MLNQHPVQLQHSAHPTRHQSHAKTGGLVPEGAAMTGELLQEQQNPAATPKNGTKIHFCYNEAREGPSPPHVNSGTTTIVPPLYATQLLQSGTCRHTRLSKSRTCTRRKATVRGPINAHGQPKQASTSSTCCCGTTQAGMHTFQNTRQLLHVSTAAQKLATAPLLMLQGHGHCSYHSTRFTAVLPPTPWTHHAMPAAPFRQRLHTLGATEA